MSDSLTCTGLPSVSALPPPYDGEVATAATEADCDPDELARALIPEDTRAHMPGPAQRLDEHLPSVVHPTIVTPCA
jgi:hypothetical protein